MSRRGTGTTPCAGLASSPAQCCRRRKPIRDRPVPARPGSEPSSAAGVSWQRRERLGLPSARRDPPMSVKVRVAVARAFSECRHRPDPAAWSGDLCEEPVTSGDRHDARLTMPQGDHQGPQRARERLGLPSAPRDPPMLVKVRVAACTRIFRNAGPGGVERGPVRGTGAFRGGDAGFLVMASPIRQSSDATIYSGL